MTRFPGIRRSGAGGVPAWFFILVTFLPLTLSAQTSEQQGQLLGVSWEAQLLGRSEKGSACWMNGPEGSLRLEVLPRFGIQEGLTRLLQQEGQGYSLILGTDSSGTFNAWGREWQKVGGPAATWVRLVSGVLSGADPGTLARDGGLRLLSGGGQVAAWRPRFLVSESSEAATRPIRMQLPILSDLSNVASSSGGGVNQAQSTDFRQQQVNRGHGRGGRQEILTFVQVDLAENLSWELKSSRKPGRILLSWPEVWLTSDPGPEVFAPLWPLGQLLVLDAKIPGTSR